MIDWWVVVRHAIWIVGAALFLSSWSYHRWIAVTSASDRTQVFDSRSWAVTSGSSGVLFCTGMALTGRWWEAVAWGVLGLFAALRVGRATANRSNAVISSRN